MANRQPPPRNYLRVRGEYCVVRHQSRCVRELPPRARRIQILGLGRLWLPGTTSACAENTTGILGCSRGHRNYLRVRGEYPTGIPRTILGVELPPRARRILTNAVPKGTAIGTTSACAENTTGGPGRTKFRRNYLRVRGEYYPPPPHHHRRCELPPRARRILHIIPVDSDGFGTTSACAENTIMIDPYIALNRNYLRVRGEYIP